MSATVYLAMLAAAAYLIVTLLVRAGSPWACFCPRSRCEYQPRRRGWECLDCGALWDLDFGRWVAEGRVKDERAAPRLRCQDDWRVVRPRRRWRYAAWCLAEGFRRAWRGVWR